MRKRITKKSGDNDFSSTRREFITSAFTFTLLGMLQPYVGPDKIEAENKKSKFLIVNGWILRKDDYEEVDNVA